MNESVATHATNIRTFVVQPAFSNRFRVEIEGYPELTRAVKDIEVRIVGKT